LFSLFEFAKYHNYACLTNQILFLIQLPAGMSFICWFCLV